ncbi:sulfatase family protein [Halosimplex amylolyticum]|uniref:sulfatase family protein n=1 Tax=Halosimplex amylolyticum TaxID=3396616 RepID=UPI003F5602AB
MNVLVIDIDSLRRDRIGAYGHDAPTTLNIDEVAADGVRFENYYVANSPCMPSRAGFVSGRYGVNNGVETHGPTAQVLESPSNVTDRYGNWAFGRGPMRGGDYRTLPEVVFEDRELHTGAVSSFTRHPAPYLYQVWHEYHQPQEPASFVADSEIGPVAEYFQTRGETVADLALDFLDRNDDGEFFLYAQFWDPHAPFNRSDDEEAEFADTPLPPYPTADQIDDHADWDQMSAATDEGALAFPIRDREALRRLYAGYDAEIRYADEHVGRLFDRLREQGRYDDTLIVVLADHGEEFGEHGVYRNHWSTYEGTQNVPLIVKPPADAAVEPGARDQLVTNVDVAPTLTDYVGADTPDGWQGRSLRPLIEGEDVDWRDHVVLDHGLTTVQRAIRTDRWKLIRTYHPGLWPDQLPDYQLFDMQSDPWEQTNLAPERPELVDDLEAEMAQWVERHVGIGGDPLREVARDGPLVSMRHIVGE